MTTNAIDMVRESNLSYMMKDKLFDDIFEYDDMLERIEKEYREARKAERIEEERYWQEFAEQNITAEQKKISQMEYLFSRLETLYEEKQKLIAVNKTHKDIDCDFARHCLEKNNKEIVDIDNKMHSLKHSIDMLKDDKQTNRLTDYEIENAKNASMQSVLGESKTIIKCFDPGHKDNPPSMNIKGNYYHCHGCGVTGSPIDYLMKYQGYGFRQAVKELQQHGH